MDISALLSLVHKAGEAVLKIYQAPFDVTWKKADDPLTQADLLANQILTDGVLELFPNDLLLSEEVAEPLHRLQNKRIWILDPIDGTREFVNKNPEFAISLGLVESGKPKLGFVLNPATGESMYGGPDFGLFFSPDFRSLPYSQVSGLPKMTTPPRLLLSHSEWKDGFFQEDYWQSRFTCQRVGSIAYKLGLLAVGKAELVVSVRPKNEWDVCAGIALVLGSGQSVKTLATLDEFHFNEENLIKPGLLAGRREILEPMLQKDSVFLKNSFRPRK